MAAGFALLLALDEWSITSFLVRQHITTYEFQVAFSHILPVFMNMEVYARSAHLPHEFVQV